MAEQYELIRSKLEESPHQGAEALFTFYSHWFQSFGLSIEGEEKTAEEFLSYYSKLNPDERNTFFRSNILIHKSPEFAAIFSTLIKLYNLHKEKSIYTDDDKTALLMSFDNLILEYDENELDPYVVIQYFGDTILDDKSDKNIEFKFLTSQERDDLENGKLTQKLIHSCSNKRVNPNWISRYISNHTYILTKCLESACESNSPDPHYILFLLKTGAIDESFHINIVPKITWYGEPCTIPIWAALNGHKDIIEISLQKGTIQYSYHHNNLALHYAAYAGQKDVVELILSYTKNEFINKVTIDRSTPLSLAVSNGHLEIATLLIEKGANINPENPLLACAVRNNAKIEMVNLLIEKGANINSHMPDELWGLKPALHYAIISNNIALRDRLLQDPYINVNIRDGNGRTALHYAKTTDNVSALINKNANINAQDENGKTALDLACFNGNLAIAALLIQEGANIYTEMPLLAHAVRNNAEIEMVNLLIAKGANINAKDENGKTALDYAHYSGNHHLIRILTQEKEKEKEKEIEIERKIDPDIPDSKKKEELIDNHFNNNPSSSIINMMNLLGFISIIGITSISYHYYQDSIKSVISSASKAALEFISNTITKDFGRH